MSEAESRSTNHKKEDLRRLAFASNQIKDQHGLSSVGDEALFARNVQPVHRRYRMPRRRCYRAKYSE